MPFSEQEADFFADELLRLVTSAATTLTRQGCRATGTQRCVRYARPSAAFIPWRRAGGAEQQSHSPADWGWSLADKYVAVRIGGPTATCYSRAGFCRFFLSR